MRRIRPIIDELRYIMRVAVPLMIAQLASVLMGFIDTLMAGRAGSDELAAVSIGSGIWASVYIATVGIVSALSPFVAHHFGAREKDKIARVTQQGIWLTLALGLISALLLTQLRPLLVWSAASPKVIEQAALYLDGIALGTPAGLLFRALGFYSSSVSNSRPVMVYGLIGLLINIPLNEVLIYGKWGLPALGGAGCGWASGLVLWLMLIMMYFHTRYSTFYRPYFLYRHWAPPDQKTLTRLLKLGLPIGGAYLIEVSAFASVALFIAQLGPYVVGGHQIVLNFSSLTYMLPQGISLALAIRVGHAVGAGQNRQARLSSFSGLGLGIACAFISAAAMLWGRDFIVQSYSLDLQVQQVAKNLLIYAAMFQVADAIQVCAAASLRGYKVSAIPMLCMFVSFWCFSMPLGYRLALHAQPFPWLGLVHPLGAVGFWISLVIGLSLAAFLVTLGLNYVSRRAIVYGV